jgi:hypothetical protein
MLKIPIINSKKNFNIKIYKNVVKKCHSIFIFLGEKVK